MLLDEVAEIHYDPQSPYVTENSGKIRSVAQCPDNVLWISYRGDHYGRFNFWCPPARFPHYYNDLRNLPHLKHKVRE